MAAAALSNLDLKAISYATTKQTNTGVLCKAVQRLDISGNITANSDPESKAVVKGNSAAVTLLMISCHGVDEVLSNENLAHLQ